MQSVSCAAEPRTNLVAKREARATSIPEEGTDIPRRSGTLDDGMLSGRRRIALGGLDVEARQDAV